MSAASPSLLLHEAQRLLAARPPAAAGLWARSVAVLARQALETRLNQILGELAPGARATNGRCQLLCLRALADDRALAERVAFVWSALSEATHHHGYELPPSAAELSGWLAVVEEFVAPRA